MNDPDCRTEPVPYKNRLVMRELGQQVERCTGISSLGLHMVSNLCRNRSFPFRMLLDLEDRAAQARKWVNRYCLLTRAPSVMNTMGCRGRVGKFIKISSRGSSCSYI